MAKAIAHLPEPPIAFGVENLPTGRLWGNMFNAGPGATADCVEAAVIHSIQYMTYAASGSMAPFVDQDALNLYELWTGYTPGDPRTDRGSDLDTGLEVWATTGITDDMGVTHKALETLVLTTGDPAQLAAASYLLGPVIFGLNLCTVWQKALGNSAIWDTVASPSYVSGHVATVIGRSTNGNFIVVTFGGLVQMTVAGFQQFTSGTRAVVSADYANPSTGKSPLGYTVPQLKQYAHKLTLT